MIPDLLSAAGITALAVVAVAVGLRLMRDEAALRRKPVAPKK